MDMDRQPDESDNLQPIDQALILALASVKRGGAPLTVNQEDLLDDWVAGRLSPSEAARAAELAAHNGLAAERVLERRLVEAANTGAAVPAALTVRVLEVARPAPVRATRDKSAPAASNQTAARHSAPVSVYPRDDEAPIPAVREARGIRWSIFGWSAAGLAFAATLAIAVFGMPGLRESTQSAQRIQLAMVTLDDRRPFTGVSQARSLRGGPTTAASTEGFRDVDIPADLLRRAVAGASGAERARSMDQLLAYLPPGAEKSVRSQVAIDSTLSKALAGEWSQRTIVQVRVYDLRDPRTKAIQDSLRAKLGTLPQALLTVRN
jgi:hypothetical protein